MVRTQRTIDGNFLASSHVKLSEPIGARARRSALWLFLTAACGASIPEPCAGAVNEWTTSGPQGGIVYALAPDPHQPGVVYVATDAGLVRSNDAGTSWMATGLVGQVRALAFDPYVAGRLYAAPGWGVAKSEDGGETWTRSTTGLHTPYVTALAVDPSEPATLYAGTNRPSGTRPGGVFKSVDGGETWRLAGMTDPLIFYLAVAPTMPTTIFARSRSGGLFRSVDGGEAWRRLDVPGAVYDRCPVAVEPGNPATVYSTAWTAGGGAVQRSTDGGSSWVAQTAGLTAGDLCGLAVDPRSSGTLYAGGERGVFKSTNAGARWVPIGGTTWLRAGDTGETPLAPLVYVLAVDPHDPARLYAASADRVFTFEQRAALQCGGDCNGDDRLSVDELIKGVAVALGVQPITACPRFDTSGDGAVSIDELTAAVAAALDSCVPGAFEVDLSAASAFEYVRAAGRGFCPPLGAVYRAQLLAAPDGLYDFYHATLEAGVRGVDLCEPDVLGADCPVVRYQPERTLTRAEAERVRNAWAQITVHNRPDPGCRTRDPCVVNSARWDGVELSDARCADRRIDAAQRTSIEVLLEELRRGDFK